MSNLHTTLRNLQIITKHGVTAFAMLGVVHCGLLYFGYDLFIIHAIACLFFLMLGVSLSQVFGLCWVHKLCVVYACSVLLCIVMRRHNVFDKLNIDITAARGVMFFLGLFLTGLVIWRTCKKN